MAKKLKVISPVSHNGLSPAHDSGGKIITKETIVELTAKKDFEMLNTKLPKELKHSFEVIDVEDSTPAGTTKKEESASVKKQLADKEAELAELKKQLEEANKAKIDAESKLSNATKVAVDDKNKAKN